VKKKHGRNAAESSALNNGGTMKPQALEGFTIGVTADRHAEEQIVLLKGQGADCLHVPLVETNIVIPDDSLRDRLASLTTSRTRLFVFTTRLGVSTLFDAADAQGIGPALRDAMDEAKVIARTVDVRAELEGRGVAVGWCASSASTREVANYVGARVDRGERVAVLLDSGEEQVITDAASSAGAVVDGFELYRTSPVADQAAVERFVRSVSEGQISAITFTTRPAVLEFARIAKELDLFDEVARRGEAGLALFAKGPVSRYATIDAGLGPSSSPAVSRIGSLVEHVSASLSHRRSVIAFEDGKLRVQGSRIWINDQEPIELPSRESGLLTALASRPGVVWSKRRLLIEVWGSRNHDTHTVEVTVARLRKRLAPAGHWIKTVPRRGYALAGVPV